MRTTPTPTRNVRLKLETAERLRAVARYEERTISKVVELALIAYAAANSRDFERAPK